MADLTASGGLNPCSSQRRQPSIIQASIPGHSARSLSGKSLSGLAIVTVNGARLRRRRIASSTSLRAGLWLLAITSLKEGVYVKKVLAHEASADRIAAS